VRGRAVAERVGVDLYYSGHLLRGAGARASFARRGARARPRYERMAERGQPAMGALDRESAGP